ncbi:MAG: hypothetical protein O9341_18020 [Paucibacter sp.]|nr:hypothetical protein [Roseateles sp.]
MTALDLFNVMVSVAGLALGYIGARGELQRIIGLRRLPKLLKDKEFYERLRSSPSAQQAYLLESVILLAAIAGAGMMFGSISFLPPSDHGAFESARLWIVGGVIYMFAMYRLGRYWNVVRRYEKTMERLNAEIDRHQGLTPPSSAR